MKKIFKKLSCVLLAAVFCCMMTPFAVNAAVRYEKNQTIYRDSKADPYTSGDITVWGLSDKQSISQSSVKVISGKNIISLSNFAKSTSKYSWEYWEKGQKATAKADGYYSISFRAKKNGTGKIAFKIGKKTYTATVRILPYVNPVSSLTVTGVKNGSSANLAGKFKTYSSVMETSGIKKAQKNAVITCKAAKGWKITSLGFSNEKTNVTRDIYNDKGVSSVSLRAGDLAAGQTGSIDISLVNVKTGGTQDCTLKWIQ